MKVIHTIPDISEEASGPSYSVTRLCESLIQDGVNVQLGLVGVQSRSSGRSYVKSFQSGFGPARLGSSPDMYRWLRQQASQHEVDLVHNHSLWMMPNIYPGWATKRYSIPYVVSPRGTLSSWAMSNGSKIKKIIWPLLQKPSIKHAALFHATAESEYLDIRRLGFKQPIAIIPNGIDLPEWQAKPDRSQRVLLYLGRIHSKKGIDSLLRVWSDLQNRFPYWQLNVSGPDDNNYADVLKAMVASMGLERVVFTGAIYGYEKIESYRKADLFVLPTHSENFAMTVAESLACGTPCVVSKGAPWSGLVSRNSGWWHEISDAALHEALRSAMAKSQAELDAMGGNGRIWMQQEFAWSRIAASMHASYDWLLKRGDRPQCVVVD